MEGNFLVNSRGSLVEPDIYADKSALVLEWLLLKGVGREDFSLREVAAEKAVSVGLVQRVLEALVREGELVTSGVRTAKKFKVKKPERLLRNWLERYSIIKKCKMWTYRTGLSGRDEALDILMKGPVSRGVSLALHSAAKFHEVKNTNLNTLELYLTDLDSKTWLERKLRLEPQERGYEVLLIKPYYKSMLSIQTDTQNEGAKLLTSKQLAISGAHLFYSPVLLTFLDLYHFPLRGREQAEFMAERIPELKRICKKG